MMHMLVQHTYHHTVNNISAITFQHIPAAPTKVVRDINLLFPDDG
jgi:hypothetical protein